MTFVINEPRIISVPCMSLHNQAYVVFNLVHHILVQSIGGHYEE
jgi:hypothetical protein